MRFIVDAQLPRRLAHELAASGHDVRHTLDLPQENRTPDGDITALAATEDRVVVTAGLLLSQLHDKTAFDNLK